LQDCNVQVVKQVHSAIYLENPCKLNKIAIRMQHLCNLLEYVIKEYPHLAEAKVDSFMKALADKYEDQVQHSSALKNKVDRPEIEYAIEFFKKFQNNIEPAEDRDITKWTIQELLQFLKSKPGYKPPSEDDEEDEQAPPIVYQDDNLTIYDGSDEGRCILYGKGEKWCITGGSFANYRYDANKKYPTFYLVRDKRLADSNPKSFFVIMIGNDDTYKASDRTNNDLGSRRGQSEWQRWENWAFVEKEFPSVKGLQSYFKYRPIPKKELDSKGMYTLEDWYYSKDLNKKNQRLIDVLRQDSNPFRTQDGGSITWEKLIKNILSRPEMKAITDLFVKSTYENPLIFLQSYEYFTPAQQKSIIANTNNPQHPVGITADKLIDKYERDQITYQAVIDLLKADKVKPTNTTHLYITGRDNVIYLDLDKDLIVVKVVDRGGMDTKTLSPKTEHYLLDDPNLASINLRKLASTVEAKGLSPKIIQTAISGESEDKQAVEADGITYVIQYDKDSISIINTKGKPVEGGLPDPVADKLQSTVKSDPAKRQSFLKSIIEQNAPALTQAQYQKILNGLSQEERTFTQEDRQYYIDVQPLGVIIYRGAFNPNTPSISTDSYQFDTTGFKNRYSGNFPSNQIQDSLDTFVQTVLPPLTTQGVRNLLQNNSTIFRRSPSIASNVRLTPDNEYKIIPKPDQGAIYLVNKVNKDDSRKFNISSGNIVNMRLSQANYDQLLGREAQPRAQRPATGTAATAEALPANSAGGNVNLQQVFTDNGLSWTSLPTGLQNKLRQGGTVKNIRADRGTDTRNGLLRGRGRITSAYQLAGTASALYIATLNSGTVVGIIASQPGNIHGVITATQFRQYRSANDLPTIMQNNNISENNNMTNKIELIRKLAEQVLRENQPAWAPDPGEKDKEVVEPGTQEEEDDDPFTPPTESPDTRPKADKDVTISKIVSRFKKEK